MKTIQERKEYLQKRNEVAKELLSDNIENLDLSSYIIPDIRSTVSNVTSGMKSMLATQDTNLNNNEANPIYEWIEKIKIIFED